jgi:hypothetical protein
MRISPTAEGGLRLDLEDETDWLMLAAIAHDAVSCDEPLAGRLGRLVTDEDAAADWREFIQPEVAAGFEADIDHVLAALDRAREDSAGAAGSLWIARGEALHWYSVLNQARLAIEDLHHFGPGERIDPASLEENARTAFLRSRFYCAFQSLLLGHAMGA